MATEETKPDLPAPTVAAAPTPAFAGGLCLVAGTLVCAIRKEMLREN